MPPTPPPRLFPSDHPGPLAALRAWRPADRRDASLVLVAVVVLHLVAFGLLLGVVAPLHDQVGGVFGIGLGLTSYTYGLRHAFDADHIAAIDNTTRKLRGDGRRSTSVGFWFAMGHSTIVAVLTALVAGGTRLAAALTDGSSSTEEVLRLVSTTLSGSFLYLIAGLNLLALARLVQVFRRVRRGELMGPELEAGMVGGGIVTAMLSRLNRTVSRPWQMYLVGLLFGLGFDTATEVSLLALAGTGAAQKLPWAAIMALPILFAAGMSLLDSLDGLFMSVAYEWAFLNPVRKVYYNLSITGLSVTVAVVIGTIELVDVLHDHAGWRNPVSDWVGNLQISDAGFVIAGLFLLTWAVAVTLWRLLRIEER